MGDLVRQGVTQQDYSVTAAVLAVSVSALRTVLFGWLSYRFRKVRPFVNGVPLMIVKDGEPLVEAMKHERMSLDDLYAQARQQGIRKLSEIELAILETDGKVSFFKRSGGSEDGAADPHPQAPCRERDRRTLERLAGALASARHPSRDAAACRWCRPR